MLFGDGFEDNVDEALETNDAINSFLMLGVDVRRGESVLVEMVGGGGVVSPPTSPAAPDSIYLRARLHVVFPRTGSLNVFSDSINLAYMPTPGVILSMADIITIVEGRATIGIEVMGFAPPPYGPVRWRAVRRVLRARI
jgi:hypothetical protein